MNPDMIEKIRPKGIPPMAYTLARGPIKRNKSRRWHAKRLAKKVCK